MSVGPSNCRFVLVIFTRDGLDDLRNLISTHACAVWVNAGVLSGTEMDAMRAAGIDLTTLTSEVDPHDDGAITGILGVVAEHHPKARLWVEFQSDDSLS